MTSKELIKELLSEKRTNDIRTIVQQNLYDFLVGNKEGFSHQEPIKTSPILVYDYLHIFISEGTV